MCRLRTRAARRGSRSPEHRRTTHRPWLPTGAVIDHDRTILVMAPSGSGKSTLTCALVASGAVDRTDEVIAIDRVDGSISTYPKPISIKHGSIPTVERLTGHTCASEASTWEITASDIGRVTGDDAPVGTIRFGPAAVEVAARLVAEARCVQATGGDAGPLAVVGARRDADALVAASSSNLWTARG